MSNKPGRPPRHGESKKQIALYITPTSRDILDAVATELGLTRSELVERLAKKGKAWLSAQVRDA